jgi:hypothetical protein
MFRPQIKKRNRNIRGIVIGSEARRLRKKRREGG